MVKINLKIKLNARDTTEVITKLRKTRLLGLFRVFISPDSPNSMRIKLLQEKWQNLQSDIDREKQERRVSLEDRVI